MAKPVYRGAWPHVRRIVLQRDRYLCQVRLEGCTIQADECDHIVPVADGGSWYDLSNLRASCRHCNRSLAGRRRQEKARRSYKPSRDWWGPRRDSGLDAW
jgi:5-methylcytosine-specific restriction protein A